MIKTVLQSIDGIGAYPAFSLALFFVVFSAIVLKVIFMNKNDVKEISELPLNDD
ncbi:MAG: CcoQ/FixQ family Cbb3-type cytochrome c oxidase assembly chaperone [Gemmatimonadetes bacterium]|nr:MAG: CcoQ/FixQ family Cbb3-type cytochrome c oxidase assembly chaperone [Gemmatimonadota bacterium]